MKNILPIFCALFLTSCFFGDEPASYKKLTKDFWLNWWGDDKDQHLLLSFSDNGNGGTLLIEETVFAVGYNDSFIVAKQHPNLEEEIGQRLFNRDSSEDAFVLSDPKDTAWLSGDDSIYFKNNHWYHISNGWNPPDSLKPYKHITYYHIIDIRNYGAGRHNGYKAYKFDNERDFNLKKSELGVRQTLS